MSRNHHYLKTETEYYKAVENGVKTFDLRKNDRDYQIGDIIHLIEIVEDVPTGRQLSPKEITYIFYSFDTVDGLKSGYCILQLRRIWGDNNHKRI